MKSRIAKRGLGVDGENAEDLTCVAPEGGAYLHNEDIPPPQSAIRVVLVRNPHLGIVHGSREAEVNQVHSAVAQVDRFDGPAASYSYIPGLSSSARAAIVYRAQMLARSARGQSKMTVAKMPTGRFLGPEEVVPLVIFLLS